MDRITPALYRRGWDAVVGTDAAIAVVTISVTEILAMEIPRLAASDRLSWVWVALAAGPAIYVVYQLRLLLVVALLGLALVTSDDAVLQTGFPSLGVNFVDLIVLLMAVVVGLHTLLRGRPATVGIEWPLLLLFAIGLIELAAGQLLFGSPTRSAFRDFRFFVYVPVVMLYLQAWEREAILPLSLLLAWYVSVIIEWLALVTGVLVLHPGAVIGDLPSSAGTSPFHFVSAAAFVPGFISMAAVLTRSVRKRMSTYFHIGFGVVSLLVLLLSFGRSLWLSVGFVGMGAVLFATGAVYGRRIAPISLMIVAGAVVVAAVLGSLAGGFDAVVGRAASTLVNSDPSSLGRLEDDGWTLRNGLVSPLGHGLGVEPAIPVSDYLSGIAAHMGYLWLLYRGGVAGLAVFGYILVRSLVRLVAERRRGPTAVGLLAGALAWSVMAAASTFMLSFMALPFWGLLLGLAWAGRADEAEEPSIAQHRSLKNVVLQG